MANEFLETRARGCALVRTLVPSNTTTLHARAHAGTIEYDSAARSCARWYRRIRQHCTLVRMLVPSNTTALHACVVRVIPTPGSSQHTNYTYGHIRITQHIINAYGQKRVVLQTRKAKARTQPNAVGLGHKSGTLPLF